MTAGERIKKLRISRKLTQVELSKEIGCADESISRIEKRVSDKIDLNILKKLGKYFDVTVDYLLYGDENKYAMSNSKGIVGDNNSMGDNNFVDSELNENIVNLTRQLVESKNETVSIQNEFKEYILTEKEKTEKLYQKIIELTEKQK